VRSYFSFDGRIGRREFLVLAVLATAFKYNLDRFVAYRFHVPWSPLAYVIFPIASPISNLPEHRIPLVLTFVLVAIPFCWLGTATTARRLRDAGLPVWLTPLFFVPGVNVAFAGVLAVWPSATGGEAARTEQPEPLLARIVPKSAIGSAVFAVAVTGALGFGLILLGSRVLLEYGWGLFVGVPFMQGALGSVVYGLRERRTLAQCFVVGFLSQLVAGGALLAFAFEGVVCIIMAFPLAVSVALVGCIFGYVLQRHRPEPGTAGLTALVLVLAVPAVMGTSARGPDEFPVYEVSTSVDVAASPQIVWQRVIAFPELDAPTELPFRVGIAYPQRARIVGQGVGAVRYCEFSTGAFVEPITAWVPGRKLAFDVTKNPEPMQEWTPFAHVHPPHLDGYMQSMHGQFVLEQLPNGKTRLTGTTWYRHHLWPAEYWRLWSDSIVHRIHARVLDHIAALAERDAQAS
jgi:uncharacterized membrane protein YhaH (DUF805 family)